MIFTNLNIKLGNARTNPPKKFGPTTKHNPISAQQKKNETNTQNTINSCFECERSKIKEHTFPSNEFSIRAIYYKVYYNTKNAFTLRFYQVSSKSSSFCILFQSNFRATLNLINVFLIQKPQNYGNESCCKNIILHTCHIYLNNRLRSIKSCECRRLHQNFTRTHRIKIFPSASLCFFCFSPMIL